MTELTTQRFDIRQEVAKWALEDQLGFDPLEYDGEVFQNRPTETIAGFTIPLVDSLTSSEDWYFRKLESSKLESLIGARGEFGQLNTLAKTELGLDENQTIWDVITGGQNGLLTFTDGREGQFILEHKEEISRFLRSWAAMSNDMVTRIAKIWFFLCSRCNSSIEPSKIAKGMLIKDQEALMNLIVREMNGGKMPEPVVENTENGNAGNAPVPVPVALSGETSTGSSTPAPISETNGLVPEDLVLSPVG